MLQDLIAFVEHGTLGELVRENDLLFPFIESVHVLAVCLVVGSIAAVDLRLLGFASVDRPVGRLMRSILPITVGAFGLAVAAGSLLFISHASANIWKKSLFYRQNHADCLGGRQYGGLPSHRRQKSRPMGE